MRHPHLPRTTATVLAFTLAGFGAAPVRAAQDAGLKIVVLEGEDGVNIIEKKTAVKPVVEVRDKNNLPVAGAVVIFSIVAVTAGSGEAIFGNGQKMVTVTTDASGRATAGELQALSKGNVQMKVQAFNKGQTASTTINQSNFVTEAEAAEAAKSKPEANEKSQQNSEQSQSQSSQSTNASSSGASSAASAPAAAAAAAPVVATTASTASTSSAAAGGAAAGGGGMSAMAVTGLIAGAAAAGAGAYYGYQATQEADCTSESTQFQTDLINEEQVCSNSSFAQCRTAAQRAITSLDRLCACVGPTGIDAQTRRDLQALYTELGLTFPSSCR